MFWDLFLPVCVAVLAAFGAAWIQRRLRPDVGTWSLTALSAGSALAVLWAVAVLAVGYAVEQPSLAHLFGWCRPFLAADRHVPTPLGVGAWLVIAAMGASVAREARRHRRARITTGLEELVHSDEPIAFAVPGRPGRIIVSAGMLSALDPAERAVLFAHERSHLRHHHHRFLYVAALATAAVPILRPLYDQVRFATERWADEDAATEVADRRVVARAIAHASLAATTRPTAGSLAMTGTSCRARVEAMMMPRSNNASLTSAWVTLGMSGIAVSFGGSTVQLHHLMAFLGHVCRLG